MEKNWLVVQAKVGMLVWVWLWRWFSLKGRANVCIMYIFHFILYWFSVLPLFDCHLGVFKCSLLSLLWIGGKLIICREICIQCHEGARNAALVEAQHTLRLLSYATHWQRILCEQGVLGLPSLALLSLLSSTGLSKCCHRSQLQKAFLKECQQALHVTPHSSDLSQPRKTLYQALVEGFVSGSLCG